MDKGGRRKGKDMVDSALKRGLIIRSPCDMYESDGWFRITYSSQEENRLAFQAIRGFFQA